MKKKKVAAGKQDPSGSHHCLVCGQPLDYFLCGVELICSRCGKAEKGHVRCPEGHFVCEACHNRKAVEIIKTLSFSAESSSPFDIAEEMMAVAGLPMLGCHHAVIAAGALMAAINHEGTVKLSPIRMEEVFDRTERQAVGGYCGLTGVCGIVPAIGACFAALLDSRCGTDREQRLTMEVVATIVQAIARITGPSCCKAYVRTALKEAVPFLDRIFGIKLAEGSVPIRCTHFKDHPHGCRGVKCDYYILSTS